MSYELGQSNFYDDEEELEEHPNVSSLLRDLQDYRRVLNDLASVQVELIASLEAEGWIAYKFELGRTLWIHPKFEGKPLLPEHAEIYWVVL